jgi:hypothetical protein
MAHPEMEDRSEKSEIDPEVARALAELLDMEESRDQE